MFLDRVAAIAPSPSTATSNPSDSTSSSEFSSPQSASVVAFSVVAFSDANLDRLARRGTLNGRQIKNAVYSAQALAVNEKKPLAMHHVLKVLEVAEAFERDLKGGDRVSGRHEELYLRGRDSDGRARLA